MIYEHHFGLEHPPFSVTPDPRFLYASDCHREALASLHYGIEARRGLLSLVGEVGTGKSTLIRSLLEQLEVSTRTTLITHTTLNRDELLWMIMDDLGLDTRDQSRVKKIRALQEFAIEESKAGRSAPVFLLDEAHNLSDVVLEEIRLLTNLERPDGKLIQVVLSGQPELEQKLAQPNLRQLNQRIAIRARLEPLDRDQTACYINHRLHVSGYKKNKSLFGRSAVEVIWRASRGIPREINNLCDQSLINAYGAGKKAVDRAIALESVADLKKSLGASGNRGEPKASPPLESFRGLAWRPIGLVTTAVIFAAFLILIVLNVAGAGPFQVDRAPAPIEAVAEPTPALDPDGRSGTTVPEPVDEARDVPPETPPESAPAPLPTLPVAEPEQPTRPVNRPAAEPSRSRAAAETVPPDVIERSQSAPPIHVTEKTFAEPATPDVVTAAPVIEDDTPERKASDEPTTASTPSVPTDGTLEDILDIVIGFQPPIVVMRVAPVYPRSDPSLVYEGEVALQVLIDPKGQVVQTTVEQSPDLLFAEAAHDAVARWIFEPATFDGNPVEAWMPVRLQFAKPQ